MQFIAVERPRTTAAENGKLISSLVDGAVTVDSPRNRQGRVSGFVVGNELRHRLRAEAGKLWIVLRREELDHLHAVAAVGYKSKQAGAYHPQLDIISVIQFAAGIEHRVQARLLRLADIYDGQSLL